MAQGVPQSEDLDPQAIVAQLGVKNYAEALHSGGDLEVPAADFLARLDPQHQQGLLHDVRDPRTGLTAREQAERAASRGGAAATAPDATAAEVTATPEFQQAQAKLRQRYLDVGQTPAAAEELATATAHLYAELAKQTGIKPAELLELFDTKMGWAKATPVAQKDVFGWDADTNNGDLKPFEDATARTRDSNIRRMLFRLIPEDAKNAPAIALNPDAYALLQKRAPTVLGKFHWDGYHLPELWAQDVTKSIASMWHPDAAARVKVAQLVDMLKANRTAKNGLIILRDGFSPEQEKVVVAEERAHAHQDSFGVLDHTWADKYPVVMRKAGNFLKTQGYKPHEFNVEISAKLMAGDKMNLTDLEARQVRAAYLDAVKAQHGQAAIDALPDHAGTGDWFR